MHLYWLEQCPSKIYVHQNHRMGPYLEIGSLPLELVMVTSYWIRVSLNPTRLVPLE